MREGGREGSRDRTRGGEKSKRDTYEPSRILKALGVKKKKN